MDGSFPTLGKWFPGHRDKPPADGSHVLQEQILDTVPEHADSATDQDEINLGIPENPPVHPELPGTGMGDADSDGAEPGAAEPVETQSADFLLDDDMTPSEKWEHVGLFEPGQHFELATTPAAHALMEVSMEVRMPKDGCRCCYGPRVRQNPLHTSSRQNQSPWTRGFRPNGTR